MGMIIALKRLGVGIGDEVITTCLTFTATAEAIAAVGAKPVIVDIDPATLNWDWEQVVSRISPRTAALLPVHFAGLPIDMDLLRAETIHGICIVEDAAHALGSKFQGVPIGGHHFSTTVFSFYPNKAMTTGEGGMIVTSKPTLMADYRIVRLHGIYRSPDAMPWDYRVVEPGLKANMDEISAAIGIAQLEKLEAGQLKRQQIAEAYTKAFADLDVELPPQPHPGDTHAWHLYVLRLPSWRSRNHFIHQMDSFGIGTSVHYVPLCLHPQWKKELDLHETDFPHAMDYFQRSVSLPIYPKMTAQDVDRVIDTVRALLT
ncbi:dTDP-4-amino-4,6-dideoxygalactose transaminase [Nostoc flagelliforme CCNUN1]|uniref:dTDP-4-amino-4,6-dideoxygalactose transaminase n=2 Tax=Nostoc flagelliforme TaxID=1306274 RepID=A0A2K8SL30_9NOSO|nr:dTDP-4-amino-4,6-dideoxygalactose transaminase [Nostoc flagelliforme CCNUN1]